MIKQFHTSKSANGLPSISIDLDIDLDNTTKRKLDKLCINYHHHWIFPIVEVRSNEAIAYLLHQGWVGIYEG